MEKNIAYTIAEKMWESVTKSEEEERREKWEKLSEEKKIELIEANLMPPKKIPVYEVPTDKTVEETLLDLLPRCLPDDVEDIFTDYVDWRYLSGNLYLFVGATGTKQESGFLVPIGTIHDILRLMWLRATIDDYLRELLLEYEIPRVRSELAPYTYQPMPESPSKVYIIYELGYPYIVFVKGCKVIGIKLEELRYAFKRLRELMVKEPIAKVVRDAGIVL